VTSPLVSIVLVTRNGAATLGAVLNAVKRQRLDAPFEIIAVDSGSTDGTLDLLRGRVDQLVEIPAATFNHGLTRNHGIERAKGDLLVLLVQDAEPQTDHWLAALVDPLRRDTRIAGTFARQRPREDASPMTKYYLSRWIAGSDRSRITSIADRRAFDRLLPAEQFEQCVFDNVCSCIRKSVWTAHPFRETPIGEDVEWAREVLLAGHSLAYVPESVVVHSHDRSARYELDRTRALHERLFSLFGLRTIPTVPALARSILSSTALHTRCQRESGSWRGYGRSLTLAVAWPLGQYLGGRDGETLTRKARETHR